jgi:hypothetical protein
MPIEGFRPDCAKPAAAGSPTRPAGSALDALRRDRLDVYRSANRSAKLSPNGDAIERRHDQAWKLGRSRPHSRMGCAHPGADSDPLASIENRASGGADGRP